MLLQELTIWVQKPWSLTVKPLMYDDCSLVDKKKTSVARLDIGLY